MKVNPANAYRNGTLYPAYTAAAYKRLFELADARGVNLIWMLSWSFEFEDNEYFEGFRSLSTNGVDKPMLNFFRMAALMKGNPRCRQPAVPASPARRSWPRACAGRPDINAMATTEGRNAAVLLWNYHDAEKVRPRRAGRG